MVIQGAYEGTIRISGAHKGDEDASIYYDERLIYGTTVGQLLDNMVAATANMAKRTTLVIEQISDGLPDDVWKFEFDYPNALSTLNTTTENEIDFFHATAKISAIVRIASHTRYIATWCAIAELNQIRLNLGLAVFAEQEYKFNPIFIRENEEAIAGVGITGVEYDSIIAIAEKDGTIRGYLRGIKRPMTNKPSLTHGKNAAVHNLKSFLGFLKPKKAKA